MAVALRTHQKKGVELIREAYHTFRRVLFVAPTAFGKTVTFSSIAQSASALGRRIIIVAHRQELIDQISRTLARFGVEHGIISPQYSPNYRLPVQVASIGTLRARLKKNKIPKQYTVFQMVIVDEAHHLMAGNTFGETYRLLGEPRLLGVTATPERGDGKGLGEQSGGVFETLIEVIDVKGLIDQGFLSDFVVYLPKEEEQVDLSDVKVMAGDFEKKSLESKVNKPKIIGSAVKEYARICPNAPAVVFCVSIEHCKAVAAQFQEAGFNFQVIDGTMTDERRKALIDGLGNGSVTGLVSCDVISEGTDVPGIVCAIFLRPTKSLGLFIQQAGRALRAVYADGYDLDTAEGRLLAMANGPKPAAILLDHAGLTYLHGLIDDPRSWSLEGRKKKKGKGSKKDPQDQRLRFLQCKECQTVHEIADSCPMCGYVYPANSRTVAEVDGTMVEFTREEREKRRKEMNRALAQCNTEEEMVAAGISRGEAHHRLKARKEKAEIVEGILADLRRWYEETGQNIPSTFGIKTFDVKFMKPAGLRELRKKIDDHFAVWRKVAPNNEQSTIEF